jgi:hypothetical protein
VNDDNTFPNKSLAVKNLGLRNKTGEYGKVTHWSARLEIHGTQVKSSIQDIVDEVAPIKKAPLWG